MNRKLASVVLLLALGVLAGCGGGSDGAVPTPTPTPSSSPPMNS